MTSYRKLDALRALADRPGTPEEGRLAREILERLESSPEPEWPAYLSAIPLYQVGNEVAFRDFLRTGSMEDLERATKWKTCPCGLANPQNEKCQNEIEHESIRARIMQMFPRGQRVFYNRWAYAPNCPGVVVGYSKDWNWVRIKFDHLKSPRSVPVYDCRYYLFCERIPYDTLKVMNIRGGMEKFEAIPSEHIEVEA
jgi:hypothetical protein